MMFLSHSRLPNIELIGKDEQSSYTAGDHPWSTENGTHSTLFLFNHSAAERDVSVRVGSAETIWLREYKLKPNETRAISINDLQAQGVPDDQGQKLNASVVIGEVSWWATAEGSPQVTGRVVQVAKDGSMARNFSCPLYYELCSVFPKLDPFPLALTEAGSSIGVARVCTDDQPEQCNDNGQYANMSKQVSWSWSSMNTSIAQITSGAQQQTSTWQGMAVGSTQSWLEASGAGFSCGGYGNVNVTPSVAVVSADITADQIVVTLRGDGSTTGPLEVEIDGVNVLAQPQNGGNYGPGTYTFSFGLDTIYPGEYTSVKASWTVDGEDYAKTTSYHINVLGVYRQTQYNTPAESQCSGGPQAITVFSGDYPSCPSVNGSVISGFDFRVTDPRTGTGSGHSINFGDVKQEAACSSGSGDLRRNAVITGALGRLGNDTVAACPRSQIDSAGTRLYIRGEGVKTVTDKCAACCFDPGAAHLDNYTTDTRCSGIGSLPNALTVQLY